MDLIIGDYDGYVYYYRNQGPAGNLNLIYDSKLQVGGVDIYVTDKACPFINDWNEDGLKDLILGCGSGEVYMFINVGTNNAPIFDESQRIMLASGENMWPGGRSSPLVIDLDNDGLKDVVCGNIDSTPIFYRNDGVNYDPRLQDGVELMTGELPIYLDATSRFAAIDWNGDGSLDLLGGSYQPRVKLFLQTAETPPAPIITLTNTGSWLVPVSGGTAEYNITLENLSYEPIILDVWTEVFRPNWTWRGPILSKLDVTIPPLGVITRDLIQNVPGSAMNGLYFIKGYVGNLHELQIYDMGEFFFHKMDTSGGEWIDDWDYTGWENATGATFTLSEDIDVQMTVAPNPFTPTTVLSYQLLDASQLNLSVYDISGRLVAKLVNGHRDAGVHEVTFDGSHHASGVYFARFTAGEIQQTQKLLLLK